MPTLEESNDTSVFVGKGWSKYEIHVLETLKDLKKGQEDLVSEVSDLRVEVGKLQVRAGTIGALAGFVGSLILVLTAFALKFVRTSNG